MLKITAEFLPSFIADATIALFTIVCCLTVILTIVKILYILWDHYSDKKKKYISPIFEEYLRKGDESLLEPLKNLNYMERLVLQKFVVYRSFGHMDKTLALISNAYEVLGFVTRDIKRLNSFFWWRRAEGARCLGQMKADRAKDKLLDRLSDPVIEVKLIAAWSLGRIGDPDVILPSIIALVNTSKLAGMRLSSTVFEIGEKAIPHLTNILFHEDPPVRILALHLLGEMKAKTAIKIISEKSCVDNDKEVRIAAYKALGTIGDKSSYKQLVTGLKDELWEVRAQAARGLGNISAEDAVELLGDALNDSKWWVRRNAGEALTKLGDKGKGVLETIFKSSESRFAKDMAEQWLNEY